MSFKKLLLPACLAALAVSVTSFAEEPQPVYLAPDFTPRVIERAMLMPHIDARMDTSSRVNFKKLIHQMSKPAFQRKGYKLDYLELKEGQPQPKMDLEAYRTGDSTWIRTLPTGDDHWALVVCLEDANSMSGPGANETVEISAALFDVVRGVPVWRGRAAGHQEIGGMSRMLSMGMATRGTHMMMALSSAMHDVMDTLPKKPK
jgi:hypothetical protein